MSRKKERNQPYIYEQVEQYLRPKRKIKPLLNKPTKGHWKKKYGQ